MAYNFLNDYPCSEIVEALVPIYCARTADFRLRTANYSTLEAEYLVMQGADEFELLKPYLVSRWRQAKQRARTGSW